MSKAFLFQAIQLSQRILFQTIQFSIKTQFSSIWPMDRAYHSGPEWTWERWQWRSTPHPQKLQHYWKLTIRLFSVISGRSLKGVLPLCIGPIGVFHSPSRLSNCHIWVPKLIATNDIYNSDTCNWRNVLWFHISLCQTI